MLKNFNTIVIGRNQNTIEEINLQAVETDKVNVARRITGGGAVYQDDGNLCFPLLLIKMIKLRKIMKLFYNLLLMFYKNLV
nr:hypothetical protein [Spiroplasma kunkelii]